ncbi:GNAT family N-acetyltransferase [Azospirillum soli]|uniref:GNAT family N-acetyltransferase n=1 Tax=Azospirillum soli TaxID=1304799 RepID=UPI001AE466F2|nr:GNAT family N-acetyltransferase [Azospirillum soli]MBP2314449.1 GNAT superfamily N-acetyltransferase [Azospirillum soli]
MLFADPLLARRLERSEAATGVEVAETARRLDPASSAASIEVAGGRAAFIAPGLPVNQAVGLGLGVAVAAKDLAEVESFFQQRGCTPRVDLCPLADRSLTEGLGARGYTIARVLNAHVRAIAPNEPMSAMPGVEVSADCAEDWAMTVAQGFLGRDAVAEDDPTFQLARLTARRPSVTTLLARIDGTPAGGAALSVQDGLAILFSASTREAYRGRGLQRALLSAGISLAAAAGCDLATVAVAPAGSSERAARELGFRHAYARMIMVREWA